MLEVPRCWKKLLAIGSFDETVTSERHSKGNLDPDPHYDEVREVSCTFPDGAVAQLQLCSGQSNYWAGLIVTKGQDDIYSDEGEPMESIPSVIDWVEGYTIKIKWI